MASNVDVKITADVVDLQAKFAVAKAESQALTAELNKLARQAAAAGGTMSSELRTSLTQAAEAAVRAKAEVAELNSQLKGSTSGGCSMVGMLGMLKGGLATLGVAVTAGQMLSFARSVEESTAHIAHEAEVLQLSITAYQDFSQAAIDSGVDTETADGAIRRFTTALGLAQEGMGVQAKAFVELGVSAHQTGDVALPQVAQALLAVKDDGERARLATELFGKSGAELIPLLKEWAQGTDNLTAKYSALGRLLDPETAKAAEAADIKLEGAWEHLKVAAAGPIATATNALASLVDMLTRVRVKAGRSKVFNCLFMPSALVFPWLHRSRRRHPSRCPSRWPPRSRTRLRLSIPSTARCANARCSRRKSRWPARLSTMPRRRATPRASRRQRKRSRTSRKNSTR